MAYTVTNPLLNTRAEAEDVLFKLKQLVEEYGCARVSDVYNLVCMLPEFRGKYDNAYGWISLDDAYVGSSGCLGYEIYLPRAIPLANVSSEAVPMKQALVIKTDMMLKPEVMQFYHDKFVEQLKSGVVIIPAFFNAELVNVPTNVEVIIESSEGETT